MRPADTVDSVDAANALRTQTAQSLHPFEILENMYRVCHISD